jgi:tristetraprolin
MSTAIMPQNTLYEFGDLMMKSDGGSVRYTLTRMASNPASNTQTTALVTSLLGNLTHHQQMHAQQQAVQHQQQQQHRKLERTQSAPAPSSLAQVATSAAANVNTSRYKTELCRPYEEFGVCKYGDKCQFAHGMAELRNLARHPKYKTELCRTYHTVGFCPYGPRCHFVHNQEEAAMQGVTRVPGGNPNPNPQVKQQLQSRMRPAALSPALSLDSSPPCSLSQSPTSSLGSFFSSDPELHSPGVIEDSRLPVFNRLSAPMITLDRL